MPAGSRNYFSDNAVVQAFRDKVRQWWSGVLLVRDAPTYGDKELVKMRKDLLDRAYWIRDKIKLLMPDSEYRQLNLNSTDELGVGPAVLIWPVAIAGIVGYMAYQLKDFAEFSTRQSYVERVYKDSLDRGATPEQAAMRAGQAADQAGLPTAETKFFGVPVKWIALGIIGVGAIMLLRGGNK